MDTMSESPTIHSVKRRAGVAGQFSVIVEVEYPGEPMHVVEFVGSTYGGPVVMILPGGAQTFVSEPGRFGEFGEDWARAFFAAA